MGGLDRQVRNEAVTVRANVFGHNYSDYTDNGLGAGVFTSGGGGYSDLADMIGVDVTMGGAAITPAPAAVNSIRVLQPHFGEVVECYIDYFSIRFSTYAVTGLNRYDLNMQVVFAIGDFLDDDFLTPRTDYTYEEIMASWKKISGMDEGIAQDGSNRVSGNRINLLPAMLKAGEAGFAEDGFNLLIAFTKPGETTFTAPRGGDTGTNFDFEKLRIAMGVTGVK